jgi:uncharacterized protein (TIGR00106 family)
MRKEVEMKVLADISVVPMGVGVSVSKYIAVCERILADSGLHPRLHAFGTNVEGEWEVVFTALRHCHEALHEMGVPRLSTSIRLGTRVDREQTIAGKIKSVKAKMRQGSGG